MKKVLRRWLPSVFPVRLSLEVTIALVLGVKAGSSRLPLRSLSRSVSPCLARYRVYISEGNDTELIKEPQADR
jgi:hypothetical protein